MINLIDLIPASQRANLADMKTGIPGDSLLADAMSAGPGVIQWPRGRINFTKEVNVDKRIQFVGEDSGNFGIPVSMAHFAANKNGFIFHRQTSMTPAPAQLPDGGGIEGLYLYSDGGGACTGVRMYAASHVQRSYVNGFGEDGIAVTAEAPHSNASGFRLDTVYVRACGRHGVYCEGADANAGLGTMVAAENCAGWAIYDRAFLGNRWINPVAHACGLGAFKDDNGNARNLWLGCYSEQGQPPSVFKSAGMVIGGIHGAGIHPSSTAIIWVDGTLSGLNFGGKTGAEIGGNTQLGLEINRMWPSMMDLTNDGNWMNAVNLAYYFEKSKVWQVRYKRGEVMMEYTTDTTPYLNEANQPIGGGELVLTDGFYIPIPSPAGGFRYRKISPEMLKALPVA